MSKLFSTLDIKSITFRNRVVVSPMCQYTATDGFANDWHLVHLGSRAVGGAALIIQEATAVLPEGRITPGDLGLWNDGQMKKMEAITNFIHGQGSIAGIQLAHAGRKGGCAVPWKGGKQLKLREGGWETVSASTLPFSPEDVSPKGLDLEGISRITDAFKMAARRALEAGYRVIEIHAAHGYLLHQFLSPLSNHRTDQYGGSFGNRIRLLLEIIEAVKSVVPKELPLFVRISATDYVEGGWNPEEATMLSGHLKTIGVDLIDCSSGGLVHYAKVPFGPGYQVPFSAKIRKETGILTGAVGLITSAEQAEAILEKGEADLIFIARESLREPYFALKGAADLSDEISWPNQYIRAKL